MNSNFLTKEARPLPEIEAILVLLTAMAAGGEFGAEVLAAAALGVEAALWLVHRAHDAHPGTVFDVYYDRLVADRSVRWGASTNTPGWPGLKSTRSG